MASGTAKLRVNPFLIPVTLEDVVIDGGGGGGGGGSGLPLLSASITINVPADAANVNAAYALASAYRGATGGAMAKISIASTYTMTAADQMLFSLDTPWVYIAPENPAVPIVVDCAAFTANYLGYYKCLFAALPGARLAALFGNFTFINDTGVIPLLSINADVPTTDMFTGGYFKVTGNTGQVIVLADKGVSHHIETAGAVTISGGGAVVVAGTDITVSAVTSVQLAASGLVVLSMCQAATVTWPAAGPGPGRIIVADCGELYLSGWGGKTYTGYFTLNQLGRINLQNNFTWQVPNVAVKRLFQAFSDLSMVGNGGLTITVDDSIAVPDALGHATRGTALKAFNIGCAYAFSTSKWVDFTSGAALAANAISPTGQLVLEA